MKRALTGLAALAAALAILPALARPAAGPAAHTGAGGQPAATQGSPSTPPSTAQRGTPSAAQHPSVPSSGAQPAAAQPATGPAAQPPASAQSAAAAPRSPVYDIELIIFRATTALGSPEDWNAEAGNSANVTVADTDTASSAQVGHFVALLPRSSFQLDGIESKLRASGTYVPVAHVAWSQTASAWGTRAGFDIRALGVDVPGLSGTVFLQLGQYLHLGLALDYAMPMPPAGLDAAPGTVFSLNDDRRVRFHRRNYYDNPAFGVIAMVTPGTSAAGAANAH